MHILLTGATGKLGTHLLRRLLAEPIHADMQITALCFSRDLDVVDARIKTVRGSIADRDIVKNAMQGVTHVVHMATCKEIPELVMDVTVKGMFWLLEEFRESSAEQFILIGGDAALGHFFYPWENPVTEAAPHRAAPGCYSLSKVLEEVMLTQAHIQYGIEGCCLRAPWIIAEDDLRYALSFGDEVFGIPRWQNEVPAQEAIQYKNENRIPVALDVEGKPLKRGLVCIEDLLSAIVKALQIRQVGCETYNISMNQPFDYGEAADHLEKKFGFPRIEIQTPYYSVHLDNTKARQQLGWHPKYDTRRLVDMSWSFVRSDSNPRMLVYPG